MKVGLGFLFGAKDSGVIKTVSSLNKGLERTGSLFQGLTINGISGISDGLERLAGSSGSLTTALSNQQNEFATSFAKSGARLGIFGSKLAALRSQAFSTAYALNAPTEAVGALRLEMERRGITPQDLGVNSFAQAVKAIEVLGIEGADLVTQVDSLRRSYGFTTQEAGAFTNTFMKQVTATGLGSAAITGLGATLTMLDEIWAQTAMVEGVQDVVKASTQINTLAAAIMRVSGGTDVEALEAARQTFAGLAKGALDYEKALAGVADWDVENLGLASVDLKGGFPALIEMIQKGDAAGFAEKMALAVGEMQAMGNKEGVTRLMNFVTELGGTALGTAVGMGNKLATALKDVGKAAKSSGLDMAGAAAQYRTGLTLDDLIDRARDAFRTRLFGIIAGDTRKFVANMQARYNEWARALEIATGRAAVRSGAKLTWLQSIAKQTADAGYGAIVKQMLAIAMIGPTALQPLFDVTSALYPMLMIAKEFGLSMTNLSKVAGILLMPFSAVGTALVAVGGAAVGLASGALTKVVAGLTSTVRWLGASVLAAGQFAVRMVAMGAQSVVAVGRLTASIAGGLVVSLYALVERALAASVAIGGRLVGVLMSAAGWFATAASAAFGFMTSALAPIAGAVSAVAGPFLVLGAVIAAVAAGSALFSAAATDGLVGPLRKVEDAIGLTRGTLSSFSGDIQWFAQKAISYLTSGLATATSWLSRLADNLAGQDPAVIADTIAGWFDGSGSGGLFTAIAQLGWGLIKAMAAVVVAAAPLVATVGWDLFKRTMTRMGEAIREYGPPLATTLWDALKSGLSWIGGAIVEYGPMIIDQFFTGLTAGYNWLATAIQDFGPGILEALWDGLAAGTRWLIGALPPLAKSLLNGFGSALMAAGGAVWTTLSVILTWAWDKAVDLWGSMTSASVSTFLTDVGDTLYAAITGAWSYMASALDWLWEQASIYLPQVFGGMATVIGDLLGGGFGDALVSAFEGVKGVVVTIISTLVSLATGLWDKLSGAVSAVVGATGAIWGAIFGNTATMDPASPQVATNAASVDVTAAARGSLGEITANMGMELVLGRLDAALMANNKLVAESNRLLTAIAANTTVGPAKPAPAPR